MGMPRYSLAPTGTPNSQEDLFETNLGEDSADDKDLSKPATKHAKKIPTFLLSWLMLTDIVGTSVLTLTGVAAELGWIWSMLIIVLMCPVAVYSAVMMVRTRVLLSQALGPHGAPTSMGHAATLLFSTSKCAATAVYVLVYGFAVLGNASYLLVIGTSLQGALYIVWGNQFCLYAAVAASCVVLLPLVTGMRFLTESVWLCFINMIILMVAIFIVIGEMVADGRAPGVTTHAVAPGACCVLYVCARPFS